MTRSALHQTGQAARDYSTEIKKGDRTALYSVRSERLFCEQPGCNLLWLWFLNRELSEGSFDHNIFAKNYDCVLSADVANLFFIEVYDLSRQTGWTSDDHFTADGKRELNPDETEWLEKFGGLAARSPLKNTTRWKKTCARNGRMNWPPPSSPNIAGNAPSCCCLSNGGCAMCGCTRLPPEKNC